MRKWSIALLLAVGQFVMVLDSTVMNVSISQLVVDLDTSVVSLQAAITFYTLTMAAFMLLGAKLCAKIGLIRAFVIGSVLYGIGSLTTGFSQNIAQLFIGWSIIEGLGAVLVIPAIAALIAANYKDKDRAVGFALIGAASGAAAAVGPLIGGFLTTYSSWRYVFVFETIIMVVLVISSRKFQSVPGDKKIKIHFTSVLLSVFGMTFLVFGILQSKTWGLVKPLDIPQVFGRDLAPFGISVCAYLIILGIGFLKLFYDLQIKLIEKNKEPLLDVRMLKIAELRSGLSSLLFQYVVIAGIFFVIPVYLQIALGYNALETGMKLSPLSISLVLASIGGTRLISFLSSRQIVFLGQGTLVFGSFLFMTSINPELKGINFAISLFVIGAGLGLLSSRLGDVNMSAVKEEQTSQVGGLQGTFQNLGSSLGAAIIGSVLVVSLTSGFVSELKTNDVPENITRYVEQNTKSGVAIVSPGDVEKYALESGLSKEDSSEIRKSYATAQIAGLKQASFFIMVLAAFSFLFSRNIPNNKPKVRKKQTSDLSEN